MSYNYRKRSILHRSFWRPTWDSVCKFKSYKQLNNS